MKYFRLILLLFGLLFAGNSFAETPGTMAQDAQKAYEAGNYPQAIQKWEELRSLGYINGNLLYNLGNASWQLGQGGRARWYYLRGLMLDPRNGQLRNNLQFIDEKLGLVKRDLPDGPWKWVQGLPWWLVSLNFFETLQVGAVLSALYFGLLFLRLWKGSRPSKWFVWIVGIPLILFAGLVLVQGRKFYFNREGVVLTNGAELLSAPTAEAKTGQSIPEGSLVPILKKQGDFRLIKTPTGASAWMEADQIGPLHYQNI